MQLSRLKYLIGLIFLFGIPFLFALIFWYWLVTELVFIGAGVFLVYGAVLTISQTIKKKDSLCLEKGMPSINKVLTVELLLDISLFVCGIFILFPLYGEKFAIIFMAICVLNYIVCFCFPELLFMPEEAILPEYIFMCNGVAMCIPNAESMFCTRHFIFVLILSFTTYGILCLCCIIKKRKISKLYTLFALFIFSLGAVCAINENIGVQETGIVWKRVDKKEVIHGISQLKFEDGKKYTLPIRGKVKEKVNGGDMVKLIYYKGVLGISWSKLELCDKDMEGTLDIEQQGFYPGDKIDIGNCSFTVNKVKEYEEDEFHEPWSGYEYIAVSITIKNQGKEEIKYHPYDFSIIDGKGETVECSYLTFDDDLNKDGLRAGTLNAKEKISGTILFEVPKGDMKLSLYYKPIFENYKAAKVWLKKKE